MFSLEAIASGTGYAVLALLLGVLVTAGFLLPAGKPEELRQALKLAAAYLVVVVLIIAVISLLIQGSKLQRGAMLSPDVFFRYLTMTQSGKVWLLREVYGAALAVVIFWFARSEASLKTIRFFFFLALPLVVSRSLTSHAIAVREHTMVVVAADATHLIATGLWGGGLLALFWVLYRGTRKTTLPLSWVAETVRRFSRLAVCSVTIIFLTGLYQSWIQVGNFEALFGTDYGRVLVMKLALFLGMVGLGALNLLSTRPRLLRAAQQNRDELSAVKKALIRVGAESLLALLVFFVTGLLSVLPPSVHAVHQAAVAIAHSARRTGSQSAVRLNAAEGAKVEIISPKPEEVFKAIRRPCGSN